MAEQSLSNVVAVLFVVQIVFSLWPVLVKLALESGISALMIAVIRDIFASLVLWIGVWFESGRPSITSVFAHTGVAVQKMYYIDVSERNLFLLLGIFSSLNSIGYVLALHYVTPFNSALLHPTIPASAAFLGAIYGVEKLTPRKILGACICIAGSIVVVVSQADLHVSMSLWGNLLLLVQSFSMAALLVGQKFVPNRHTSLKTTAVYYSLGLVLSGPGCLLYLAISDGFSRLRLQACAVILFGALFVVAFNYAALTWANKASSPAVPASSMMLQPPLTYLLGCLFEGKQLTGGWEVGGGLVIIAGLVLTIMPLSAHERDNLRDFAVLSVGSMGLQGDYDEDDEDEERTSLQGGFIGSLADEEESWINGGGRDRDRSARGGECTLTTDPLGPRPLGNLQSEAPVATELSRPYHPRAICRRVPHPQPQPRHRELHHPAQAQGWGR